MKYLRLLVCAFLSSCFILSLNGQNQLVKVWPDGIPGSIKNDTYIEKMSETNGEISRFDKVTDPTMYVYLPATEKATGTAVLICPGGAYGTLAFGHEGIAVAKWFNENGIAGIVLKYRLPSDLIMKDKSIGPLQDVQEAMRIIRRNSKKWNINPAELHIFQKGGHGYGLSTGRGTQSEWSAMGLAWLKANGF